jgi:hypothetical protein
VTAIPSLRIVALPPITWRLLPIAILHTADYPAAPALPYSRFHPNVAQ